jgi:transposase-like protein
MKPIQKETKRYSISFKQKVIKEIEEGKITKSEARKLYGIGGSGTVEKWIRKIGKLHLLNKIVRIELKDEVSRIKQLEKEKKDLESALAQAHLKLIVYESIISVSEEELGIDLKKNLKSVALTGATKPVKGSTRRIS